MQKTRIELDKARYLRFDINALAAFDEENKTPFMELQTGGALTFATIRNLLWAGLLHEDEGLTPHEAGNLIQKYWFDKNKNLDELMQVLTGRTNTDMNTTTKKRTSKKKAQTRKKTT